MGYMEQPGYMEPPETGSPAISPRPLLRIALHQLYVRVLQKRRLYLMGADGYKICRIVLDDRRLPRNMADQLGRYCSVSAQPHSAFRTACAQRPAQHQHDTRLHRYYRRCMDTA